MIRGIVSRFIPTYVGHTPSRTNSRPSGLVHPHIRGAYSVWACTCALSSGSSPHTWGIPVHSSVLAMYTRFIPTYVGHTRSCNITGQPLRFIPTYVGHTSSQVSQFPNQSVHPHIRGAYFINKFSQNILIGSSPHTWGIQVRAGNALDAHRFIPTYVGHTPRNFPHRVWQAVHPHIRGAYQTST